MKHSSEQTGIYTGDERNNSMGVNESRSGDMEENLRELQVNNWRRKPEIEMNRDRPYLLQ